MRYPRLMKIVISILTCGLLSFGTCVQAAVPEDAPNSITLEKTVEFEDTEGEEVLVAPGTYAVGPGAEQLTLTPQDSTEVINIAAKEDSYKGDFPSPGVALIDVQRGDDGIDNIIVLLLPNGQSLQAIGTEASIQSRGIPGEADQEEELPDPSTVTFDKSVHFIAPDGSLVVVTPGTYTAEVAQEWIRLIPGQERHSAMLIEAQRGTHETENEDLLALSLPGSATEALDLHSVMLLLPNGQSLTATHIAEFNPAAFIDTHALTDVVLSKFKLRLSAVLLPLFSSCCQMAKASLRPAHIAEFNLAAFLKRLLRKSNEKRSGHMAKPNEHIRKLEARLAKQHEKSERD